MDTGTWLSRLGDAELLDVLGLSPAQLAEPGRWCQELRDCCALHDAGFATSAEVELWRRRAESLGDAARQPWSPSSARGAHVRDPE